MFLCVKPYAYFTYCINVRLRFNCVLKAISRLFGSKKSANGVAKNGRLPYKRQPFACIFRRVPPHGSLRLLQLPVCQWFMFGTMFLRFSCPKPVLFPPKRFSMRQLNLPEYWFLDFLNRMSVVDFKYTSLSSKKSAGDCHSGLGPGIQCIRPHSLIIVFSGFRV